MFECPMQTGTWLAQARGIHDRTSQLTSGVFLLKHNQFAIMSTMPQKCQGIQAAFHFLLERLRDFEFSSIVSAAIQTMALN
jgi:hypothetical protein